MNYSPCSLHFLQKWVHLQLILLCWSNSNHLDILRHDQVEYGMKHTTLKARNGLKEHSKLFQHCYQLYTATNEVKEMVIHENQLLDLNNEISFLKEQAESLGKSWTSFSSSVDRALDSLTSVKNVIKFWKLEKESVNALIATLAEYQPQISEISTKVGNWISLAAEKSNPFFTVFKNCTDKLLRSFKEGVGAGHFLSKDDKNDAEPFIPEVFEQLRTLFLELALLGSRLESFIIPDEKSFIQFIILKEDFMRLEEEILTRIKLFEKNLRLVLWSAKIFNAMTVNNPTMLSDIQNIHYEFEKVYTGLAELLGLDDIKENWVEKWDRHIKNGNGNDIDEYLDKLAILEDKATMSKGGRQDTGYNVNALGDGTKV